MEESTTYQWILQQGKALGVQVGAVGEGHKMFLRVAQRKFGPPSAEIEATIYRLEDVERLERMAEAVLAASSWEEVLATP